MRSSPLQAFTLVEVLVSCSVMMVLLIILAGATSNFSNLIILSNTRLETGKQARAVFDRLNFDLNSAINHGGVSLKFLKNQKLLGPATTTLNDAIVLLASAKSTSADSRMAKIGYEVNEQTNASKGFVEETLTRCVEPFLWTDSTSALAISNAAARQTLAPGVFRLELAFLKKDGTIVAAAPPSDEIKAVICAVAVLNEDVLARLKDSERKTLADSLPDAVDGSAPLAQWNLANLGSMPSGVVQNVRFHQRFFYLK